MRIGITFSKKGMAKFISHLDLQRTFGRAIRRANLPVKLSQGFNPHYVVSFASALALGTESEYECVEMATIIDVSPEEFLAALDDTLPPGIRGIKAVRIADKAPKLMAACREAEYRVYFENAQMDKIKKAIYDIMESKEIIGTKISKGIRKNIDIRSQIIALELKKEYLLMRLVAAPSGSLKPDLVIDELKKRVGDFMCRVVRTGLFAYSDSGAIDLLTASSKE